MSTPTTTNATGTEVDSIISELESILVPIAENAIIAAVPTLGLPVVKQITEAILQGIANEATKIESLYASFVVDDVQVASEEGSVSTALQAVIAAEQSGDSNALQAAIKDYQAATSALDNDNGSVDP